jgi:hypothetical protein
VVQLIKILLAYLLKQSTLQSHTAFDTINFFLFEIEIEGIKENGGGDEFKYDIFDILLTFVNATMYPHPAQNKKKSNTSSHTVHNILYTE